MTMEFKLNDDELDELHVDTISINTPFGTQVVVPVPTHQLYIIRCKTGFIHYNTDTNTLFMGWKITSFLSGAFSRSYTWHALHV